MIFVSGRERGGVIKNFPDSFLLTAAAGEEKAGKREGKTSCGVRRVVFLVSNRWQQSVVHNGAAPSCNGNERGMTLQADLYQLQP